MSGAGKTVAIQSFEDIGYFTIDNMPPSLVPKVIELVKHSEETDKIALVIDMRSRLFFDEINVFWINWKAMRSLIQDFYSWMLRMVNWFLVIKRHVVATHWRQMAVFWMASS